MAIQIPNPGTGNGATGDNEFVLWSKVKDNFSDQTNAASKLVGIASGQVPLAQQVQKLSGAFLDVETSYGESHDLNNFQGGHYAYIGRATNIPSFAGTNALHVRTSYMRGGTGVNSSYRLQEAFDRNTGERYFRAAGDGAVWSAWAKDYTSANTTREPSTGYIKTSSPVLHLLHNDFEKIHEAEQLDIKLENPKTGVYRVSGTTGLRKNDGWYFSPPKDEHNNVLCMVEVEEDGDVVVVKTYKKKFDFETVSIVPDYDNPTDIPDGAIVMLRFNDLPYDNLDDIQTEV